jgi:hypothetical protein
MVVTLESTVTEITDGKVCAVENERGYIAVRCYLLFSLPGSALPEATLYVSRLRGYTGEEMNRLLSAVLAALFTSVVTVTSIAQDKPIAEVTGSYQFDHLTLSDNGASASSNVSRGWDGSVNVPILHWFGVVGDVGRVWKSESTLFSASGTTISASATGSLYTYGGGPQLTYRQSNVQPFARCLFGDAHSSGFASVNSIGGNFSVSSSTDSFFIAPGGGADFRITHNIWLRGGADYFRTNKYGATVNGIRAFGGITFTFGGTGASSDQQGRSQHSQPQRTTDAGMNIAPLGITVTVGENTGAKIVDVATNGVAGKAGLHSGDVINAVDGKSVRTPMELAAQLASRAGNKVRLGYLLHGLWQTEMIVALGESR